MVDGWVLVGVMAYLLIGMAAAGRYGLEKQVEPHRIGEQACAAFFVGLAWPLAFLYAYME